MRTLERLVKKIDKGTVRKSEKATVFAVDGNRIDIRTGSSNAIIRNVEVSGSTDGLEVGDIITIIYVNDRPFALVEKSSPVAVSAPFSIADMSTTDAENMAVKLKDYIATVAPSKTVDFPTSETSTTSDPDAMTTSVYDSHNSGISLPALPAGNIREFSMYDPTDTMKYAGFSMSPPSYDGGDMIVSLFGQIIGTTSSSDVVFSPPLIIMSIVQMLEFRCKPVEMD